jgi:hypothetical protein
VAGNETPTGNREGSGETPNASDELHDAPPFLTWRAIYIIVLAALAADIVLAVALGAHYG